MDSKLFYFFLGPCMTSKLNVRLIGTHNFLWPLKEMKLFLNSIEMQVQHAWIFFSFFLCVCVCVHVCVCSGGNFLSDRLKTSDYILVTVITAYW